MEFQQIVKLTILKKTYMKSKKDGKEYWILSVFDYKNNDFRKCSVLVSMYNSVEENKNYNFNVKYNVFTNGTISFKITEKV